MFRKVMSKSAVVSRILHAWPTHCQKTKNVHDTIAFLLVTVPNIHRLKFFSLTDSAMNDLMACFAYINVSEGSVATYAKCGGIFKST